MKEDRAMADANNVRVSVNLYCVHRDPEDPSGRDKCSSAGRDCV
jgi:hypothetical protein